ncbi:MAG TPA: hypothetical protein VM029_08680, partial [Opitutaceae bacterium]|nr:hypothetical protein [Opitutaceae bacterium]
VRLTFSPANDGTSADVTATLDNDLDEAFSRVRVVFVLRRGEYAATGGAIESAVASDDGGFKVVTVRVALPAKGRASVRVSPR